MKFSVTNICRSRSSYHKKMAWGLLGAYLLGFGTGTLTGYFAQGSPHLKITAVTWYLLFAHNLLVFLGLVIAGFLSGGYLGFVLLPAYGLISGVQVGIAAELFGPLPTTASILTHGIPEIASLIIAVMVGSNIGSTISSQYLQKSRSKTSSTKAKLSNTHLQLLKLSTLGIGLLFLAALLESFVSPFVFNALH